MRWEKGWRLNGKQPRHGTPDGACWGELGDSHSVGEGTFPGPVLCVPIKSRTFLYSPADIKPWLGVQARQTWEGRSLPHLERCQEPPTRLSGKALP